MNIDKIYLKFHSKVTIPFNYKTMLRVIPVHINVALLFLLSTSLNTKVAHCQQNFDSGNRNFGYDDRYNEGGANTLLQVVRSINYLSEVSNR